MGLFSIRANRVEDVCSQLQTYVVGDAAMTVDEQQLFAYKAASLEQLQIQNPHESIVTRRVAFSVERAVVGTARSFGDHKLGQLALVEEPRDDDQSSMITAAVIVPSSQSRFGRSVDVVFKTDVTEELDAMHTTYDVPDYETFYTQTISHAIFAVVNGPQQT